MVRRCIHTLVTEEADVEAAVLRGTANLLAKALSISIDLDAALDVALDGIPRRSMSASSTARRCRDATGFDALMIRDAMTVPRSVSDGSPTSKPLHTTSAPGRPK